VLGALAERKELTDEIKGQLNQALKEFGQQFSATKTAAA
jgi:hypothetical protein